MYSPQIPYIDVGELPLGFLKNFPILGEFIDPARPPSIKPFGTLVALGVYLGSVYAMRRAKDRRIDPAAMSSFIFWVVGAGFIGAHVLDAIFYHPRKVAEDPLYLFKLWEGLSSYGGFIGAMIGAFAYRHYKRERILPYVDTVVSCFPLAWLFGRAGCSVVHDHPGRISDAWFAVKYPNLPPGLGRFDLGLYELVLSIPLAVLCAVLWKGGRRPYGFFPGLVCVYYAPVRFLLDFFRAPEGTGLVGADPRYGGLTPAQWACFGLLALGLFFLFKVARDPRNVVEAAVDAAGAPEEESGERPRRSKRKKSAGAAARPKPSASKARTEARADARDDADEPDADDSNADEAEADGNPAEVDGAAPARPVSVEKRREARRGSSPLASADPGSVKKKKPKRGGSSS